MSYELSEGRRLGVAREGACAWRNRGPAAENPYYEQHAELAAAWDAGLRLTRYGRDLTARALMELAPAA